MSEDDQLPSVNRRSALAAIGTGAGTVVGLDAFSQRAVAWDRFDVCFRGCDEVWMIVSESDVDAGGVDDPPPVAHVIVAAEGAAVCRPVEFTAANVTRMPDRFGSAPVVTYEVGAEETILGVLEYNYTTNREERFDEPVWCVNANDHDCATMAETPDLLSAPCLPADHPYCPGEELCGDDGRDGGGGDGSDGGGGDGTERIDIDWENCSTVTLSGPDEDLDELVVHSMRCFEDPGEGCPDGARTTIEDPELPLTIDREDLAVGDEELHIDAVELVGDVHPDDTTPPDHFECRFDTQDVDVTFEDCETVKLTGDDEDLEEIVVHPMLCHDDSGEGCPDGLPGGRSFENPSLPMTIGRQDMAVGDTDYRIVAVELVGDVTPDHATPPDHLQCAFGEGPIEVSWSDCDTVLVTGSDEGVEEISVRSVHCFGGSGPCPDGAHNTIDDPEFPLYIDDSTLPVGDEEYFITVVEIETDEGTERYTKPDDLECTFESANDEIAIQFQMDDQRITLGPEEDPVSTVTITGRAEFGYSGWGDDGPVDHAFLTTWGISGTEIDFPERDIQRYYDVDGDTNIVTKDVEITFDLPANIGDPDPGEVHKTRIVGHLFAGLEQDSDTQPSLGDWREDDPMNLTIEREEDGGSGTADVQATWEDCETVEVTGDGADLDGITVHYLLCFDDPGPCPDGTARSVDDPDLPLTIEDQYLTVDEVDYTIAILEFDGDVEPDHVERPDDMDCSFE
jgi:hypothetical protein